VPIAAGSCLGPYEIVSLLGAGGMGEVYRARDQRLDRTVAVKVLPAALSSRPDLRQRLEREARTISSLTHPNICTLFDIGETPDGTAYLVMEYLEGESLAARLARGPLPLRQALRFGADIADALDRAHRQGIVHRDLKPANVMLTKSGVKLLDFGLAKLITIDGALVSDPNSPTVQQPNDVTAEGTIVGTLQYMSPEQLEGKVADARSDIFAFGATLYEMLTGQRAFQAGSRAGTIARILHDDPPPITSIAPAVPAPIARLIEHCLMKEPDERWQTARDVAIQLRGAAEGSGSGEAVAPRKPKGRGGAALQAAALLLFLAAGIAGTLLWQRMRPVATQPKPALSHLSIALAPDDGKLALAHESVVAISPDGSKVVFLASAGDTPRLYLRRTDSYEVTPLPGTEHAWTAFFSPDGNDLGFSADGKLQRMSVAGGTPEVLAEVGPAQGASWGSDGRIVFNRLPSADLLYRVPEAGGGKASPFLPAALGTLTLPAYVPERNLLFAVREVDGKPFDEAEIVVVALDSKQTKVLLHGSNPRYVVATSELLFARDGKLWSVGFDPKSLSLRGTPAVLIDRLLVYPGSGQALYDVTAAGDLVYAPFAASLLDRRLMLVARDGTARPLPFSPGQYESVHLAADGKTLGLEVMGANNDVWLGDIVRGTLNRVTSSWENLAPVLAPDGQSVLVARHHGTMPRLNIVRTDGVGEPRPVAASDKPRFPYSFSPDGSLAAFSEPDFGNSDVSLLRMSDGVVLPLLRSRFNETEPALSPDSKWIAYVSDETGRNEVYVRSIASEGTRARISTDGGREPIWAHSGRELFFRHGDSILAAAVALGSSVSSSAPVRLFDFPIEQRDISRSYDVMPDDAHFVIVERSAAAGSMRTLNVLRRSP
jgi:hypothetical protein